MEKENGGSAFPRGTATHLVACGLTKREYFAAHCPIKLVECVQATQGRLRESSPEEVLSLYAQLRFAYADAMLAEGEK